jgi:hypothetical protein
MNQISHYGPFCATVTPWLHPNPIARRNARILFIGDGLPVADRAHPAYAENENAWVD